MQDDPFKRSVTGWIDGLRNGEDQAAMQVWHRYFDRLVKQASNKLGNAARRIADEEDIAVSVFDSLCQGATEGRFQQLRNRDDLWRLLVAMTRMKAVDQVRRQTAKKRGGVDLRGESVIDGGREEGPAGFDQFLAEEPTPEFLAMLDEQHQELLKALPDEQQRQIAILRMEGFTNEEISKKLDISLRSVERKLKLVRLTWSDRLKQ